MYYVYILKSGTDRILYIGCTNDLKRRFSEHQSGRVYATKNRRPFEVIYYESFVSKHDAFNREHWLKTGYGRRHIQTMLTETLKNLGG